MANIINNFLKNRKQSSDQESVFPGGKPKDKKELLPKASNEEIVNQFKKDVAQLNEQQLNKIILELESHKDELQKKLKPEGYELLLKDLKEKGH